MHTKYYKIVKQLKSFKIIIVAPTCFGLHKPSSGSSQPVLQIMICNRSQHCNFSEAQADSFLMMDHVNRNILEQRL